MECTPNLIEQQINHLLKKEQLLRSSLLLLAPPCQSSSTRLHRVKEREKVQQEALIKAVEWLSECERRWKENESVYEESVASLEYEQEVQVKRRAQIRRAFTQHPKMHGVRLEVIGVDVELRSMSGRGLMETIKQFDAATGNNYLRDHDQYGAELAVRQNLSLFTSFIESQYCVLSNQEVQLWRKYISCLHEVKSEQKQKQVKYGDVGKCNVERWIKQRQRVKDLIRCIGQLKIWRFQMSGEVNRAREKVEKLTMELQQTQKQIYGLECSVRKQERHKREAEQVWKDTQDISAAIAYLQDKRGARVPPLKLESKETSMINLPPRGNKREKKEELASVTTMASPKGVRSPRLGKMGSPKWSMSSSHCLKMRSPNKWK